jgi:3-oxoadipate enol-lactonase
VRGLQAGQELVPISSFADRIRRDGLAAWVAQTASARLGSAAAAGLIEFWTRLMAGSDERVCIAMMRAAARVDVSAALERVVSPTLVIASESSRIQDLATVRAWQRRLARSELFVLPGDSPHLAATAPDKCAERVLSFTLRVAGHAQHVSPAMAPGASATKLASTNRLDR